MNKIIYASLSVFAVASLTAQNVGINTDGSNPTMMLDVKPASSASDGIRINNPNGGDGDAVLNLQNNGADVWTLGFDDSDNDDFKISQSGTLGTTNALTVDGVTLQILSGTAGTAADPVWSFEGDDNTGAYNSVADNYSISAGGSETVRSNTTSTSFMNEVITRDGAASSGDILVRIFDSGDDGVIDIRENNGLSHRLHGNGTSVYNEQALDLDYRFESVNRTNMIRLDAGNDLVRFGSNAGDISIDGTVISGFSGVIATADLLADFDNGALEGSTMGLGSIEALTDGSFELLLSNADWSPDVDISYDIGWSNSWDDIYCDDFWNVSDSNYKYNIEPIPYGLSEVVQMNPVTYILKNDPFGEQKIGLLAQEVEPLVSEAVKTHDYKIIGEDVEAGFQKVEMDRMYLSYVNLVPVLIQALKEEDEKVDELQNQVEELTLMLEELTLKLEELTNLVEEGK